MKRRSREEIIVSFLENAYDWVTKTHLVYSSNTNFEVANNYIQLLIRNDLLECSERKYRTTEKGKQYIETAKNLNLL